MDDLLIISNNKNEHLEHLELVLQRLEEHTITFNIEKCEFEKEEVNFLGHVISGKMIRADPEKIQTIQDYLSPKNKKQLQGFLGTVNFCANFTENFPKEMVPLL